MTFKVHRIEWQVPNADFVLDAELNARGKRIREMPPVRHPQAAYISRSRNFEDACRRVA
jgi:hypothetical protein